MGTEARAGRAIGQQGFSLLVVLLALMAIAAILTPLTLRAKSRAVFSASLLRVDQLNLLSEGTATLLAARAYGNDRNNGNRRQVPASNWHVCKVGAIVIHYSIQDHAGLINVNLADRSLLEAGFRSLDFGEDAAQRISDAVIAFRSFRQEDKEKFGSTFVDGPKKAPLETVSELYDIRSVQVIELQRLNETFSAHSGTPRINVDKAPPALKSQLQANRTPAGGISSKRIYSVSVRTSDGHAFGQFNGVYSGSPGTAKPQILETWKLDLSDEEPTGLKERDCSVDFGPGFEPVVALMG